MDEEKLKEFGVYLKSLREESGLTLNELANKTGYSDAYVSQVEKGRRKNPPTIDMLKQLSVALETPFSNLLQKAGYEELAEGQYYKEMLSALGLDSAQEFPLDIKRSESNESLKSATKLLNLWFDGVVKWTEDVRFTDNETLILREHFAELLIRYKQLIESLANTNVKWINSKDYLKELWGASTTEVGLRQNFLRMELDSNIQDITEWINYFPNYIASNGRVRIDDD